jgi:pimeloyl-ACP methyl ester carboxylesterase
MKTTYRFSLLLLLVAFTFGSVSAQQKRKGGLGVQPSPLNDELVASSGLKAGHGLLVDRVVPGSTAEALKVQVGDILLELNGQAIHTVDELVVLATTTLWGGEDVTAKVWRSKKEVLLKGKVVPKPFESPPVGEVVYDFFDWKGGKVRTILRKPAGAGPFPTVFFIPGYNCFSFDALRETDPYEKMIRYWVEQGFAVARVEKPGMGDCQGTPMCPEIDFLTEQECFETGYLNLKKYAFVDQANLFVFGHSMGGIAAPLLAAKYHPKGVMVYGTRHEPWSEYLMQMLRFQNVRVGVDYLANEQDMILYKDFLYRHYVKGEPLADICKDAKLKAIVERDFQYDGKGHIFGRAEKFWQDLEYLNMAKAWSEVDGHVLSMFGESDFEVINDWSHREIVNIVNHYHPGHGTFMSFPGTSHMMVRVGSMEEGVALQQDPAAFREAMSSKLNTDVFVKMTEWMRSVM